MRHRLGQGIVLVVFWMALSGNVEPLTIVAGVVVATTTMRIAGGRVWQTLGFRPLRWLRFFALSAVRLVVSSIDVAREVITPRRGTEEAIIEIEVGDIADSLLTVIANSISLHPGTVTVDADEHSIFVHVLDASRVSEARADLQSHVAEVRHAFEPKEDR